MSAALLSRLIAAGTPPELVAEVAMLAARADADREAIQGRRKKDRERQSSRRSAVSRDITLDHVPSREICDEPAPSPPPLLSPQTPQTTPPPLPHPDRSIAYASEATRLVLAVIEAGCRAAIAERASRKARWPKDMPPPEGVSADQWAGYIDHRKAKREHLTPRAYQLLSTKLAAHADDEWPPGRIIDHIVERGWTSFEPGWLHRTNETRNGKRTHQHDRPRRTGNGLLDAVIDAEHQDRTRPGAGG